MRLTNKGHIRGLERLLGRVDDDDLVRLSMRPDPDDTAYEVLEVEVVRRSGRTWKRTIKETRRRG